jgi:hypothetical protein
VVSRPGFEPARSVTAGLPLAKFQRQPDPACKFAAATAPAPHEIADPGMPAMTFQQVKKIESGGMAAPAGRRDGADRTDEVADPGRIERHNLPADGLVLFSHTDSMRPAQAAVNPTSWNIGPRAHVQLGPGCCWWVAVRPSVTSLGNDRPLRVGWTVARHASGISPEPAGRRPEASPVSRPPASSKHGSSGRGVSPGTLGGGRSAGHGSREALGPRDR